MIEGTPTMVHTPDNVKAAISADTERTLSLAGMTCATLVALALLASVTYCGSQPTPPDPVAIQEQKDEAKLKADCLTRGGTWLPVKVPEGSSTVFQNTCVMPAAVPLVQQLNK